MPRFVLIGTGTEVGKSYVATAIARELQRLPDALVLGLKPIETGLSAHGHALDAAALQEASTATAPIPHPLYSFDPPISPHLAARRVGVQIDPRGVSNWLENAEQANTSQYNTLYVVLETAGGVFSPISEVATNFELAKALEPATWILVAPDGLGVLHDVRATWEAMRARGRAPDHLVLTTARQPDASTGSNASELVRLGLPAPAAVVRAHRPRDVRQLLRSMGLTATQTSAEGDGEDPDEGEPGLA